MGKYGKYQKLYKKSWESERKLKDWIQATPEKDVIEGKPQAMCKWCNVYLRAHHADLLTHATRLKHIENGRSLNRDVQPSLLNYAIAAVNPENKIADLTLAVFIAMHCSIKSIDHLGEILSILGKGSALEKMRIHPTKCSKLIQNVIAPVTLKELLGDIDDSPYSLIVDESTDITVTKFMAICIRYYSKSQKKFVTDFLGLIHIRSAVGENLAVALVEFLESMSLHLKKLRSVGVDGAPNMCGIHNSFFTHLKKQAPNVQLFKCVCHSLDKCAEWSYKCAPSHLDFILSESHNWLNYPQRRGRYIEFYMARNEGKEPLKTLSLSQTRWLIWLPVSNILIDQWHDLRDFFIQEATANRRDFKLVTLARLYEDNSNLLYLTFMRTILKEVNKVNLAFEYTDADVTKLYTDLRNLVYSTASRVIKERALAETSRPGVLREDEVAMLKAALENSENLRPVDQVKLGENFNQLAKSLNLPIDSLNNVRQTLAAYLLTLCQQLISRMPCNLKEITKLKFFTPRMVMTRIGRPAFSQLPLEFDRTMDLDQMESQWEALGACKLNDVCPHSDFNKNVDTLDTTHFWGCVLDTTSATGEKPFKELAEFALKALTVVISNAVVERVFSFMSDIKCKKRNRLQMQMLEALLRVRVHMKVKGVCCRNFEVTQDMLRGFNSRMYQEYHGMQIEREVAEDSNVGPEESNPVSIEVEREIEDLEEEDYQSLINLFND